MEPPGGLPPDRDKDRGKDRQLMLRPQTQQLNPKPNTLTLNLPNQQQQAQGTTITTTALAISPAIVRGSGDNVASGSTLGNFGAAAGTSATTPTLASAATAISATTQAATAFSGTSIGHPHPPQHHSHYQHYQHPQQHSSVHHASSHANSSTSGTSSVHSSGGNNQHHHPQQHHSTQQQHHPQQTIEKLSRPMAFDKMEALVREMQDPEHGVPVRQQKMFLTSIPYAFMGYDLIEWLMDRLMIEESEALNIANQLCLHGYFFPVNDTKTLTVKDDSSLYRFQTPYYWPWQHKAPDNVEYAIYLVKRSLRNKQRHALEDYEAEALASLHKNLKGKWDFISMQAEEQVRLAKERKKGDKIVGDSQERAYWRVHRPPPGQFTPLEPCPVPSRDRQGSKQNKKKTVDDIQREVEYLRKSLNRTRMKMTQACESLVAYSETFIDYDFFLQPVLPSNPWVTEDITFWQLNNSFVDIPTEKRVRRWAISIEELVSDPTGLQEFTLFLEKEYSHENIRFWIAVNRLRRSAHSQVARKVQDIYEEFLKPGAPCEINIDGKTMESVLKGLKQPSRFTFDSASEHIYMLLLKKDCYPRFVRSDHYKRLLESGIQPSHKKRFFNFGGVGGAKKKMTAALSSQPNLGEGTSTMKSSSGNIGMMQAPAPGSLSRRRGSDRSLTGSAHELAVIGVNKDPTSKVPHSHSQSNLSEIPYSSDAIYRGDMPDGHLESGGSFIGIGNTRTHSALPSQQETPKPKPVRLETTVESTGNSAICPWDVPDEPPTTQAPVPNQLQTSDVKLSVCPWEQSEESSPVAKVNQQRLTSTSSDITDVADRLQRNHGIRHQNTVDSGEAGIKRLIPNFTEQRRASVSFTPGRPSDYANRPAASVKTSTPSPTVGSQTLAETPFLPFIASFQAQTRVVSIITKDPPSDIEIEEELNRLSISNRNSESSTSELPTEGSVAGGGGGGSVVGGNRGITPPTPIPTPTPTPPPKTKVTPPPPDNAVEIETQTTIKDNPSESPQSDVFSTDASSSGPVFEDIVVAEVQELQIELIETLELQEQKSPLDRGATPTIQIDDEVEEEIEKENISSRNEPPISRTPSPKLHTQFAMLKEEKEEELVEVEEEEDEEEVRLEIETHSQVVEKEWNRNTIPIPPPPPELGPMEEEAQENEEEESLAAQEELSPTTDEYQEGIGMRFGKDDYSYEIVDTDTQAGYIPPAPTPAPSLAPLAELDIDTVDDDFCCESMEIVERPPITSEPVSKVAKAETETLPAIASGSEEVKKRRKKRSFDAKKMSSLEEKDKEKAGTSKGGKTKGDSGADHNAVCPWEDENVSTSDGTFVKTYATLGYL